MNVAININPAQWAVEQSEWQLQPYGKAYKFAFHCWLAVRTKVILKTEPCVGLLQVYSDRQRQFYVTSGHMFL